MRTFSCLSTSLLLVTLSLLLTLALTATHTRNVMHTFTGSQYATNLFSQLKLSSGPYTKVVVSAELRSIGSVRSTIYLGLAHYKLDGSIVTSHESFRAGNAVTLQSAEANKLIPTVHSAHLLATWHQNSTEGRRRCIGFYFDGDCLHAPDYVYCTNLQPPLPGSISFALRTDAESGAYWLANGEIHLTSVLPYDILAKVQPGRTVVMNHYALSAYHYGAASSVSVATNWTRYSATYEGEAFNDLPGKHRVGAASVGFLLIANWGQGLDAVLELKNPEFYIRTDGIMTL